MAIFATRLFDKKFKSLFVTDSQLCSIAYEVMNGRFEGDLGGGVIKKRIAINAGKSGGARTIIFFKLGTHLFLLTAGKKIRSGKTLKRSRMMNWKFIETLLEIC